jgi:hopanoid biosynthesis associated protein HpnK
MTALRRLIVNADDFGLHPSANQAILKAHREGIVTSTTVLTGGSAFLEAIPELKTCPTLGVGVHLCLVDQKPVLDTTRIPSLVDSEGRFPASHVNFVRRLALRRVRMSEVRLELEAQVALLLDHGIIVTHLDSHQHLHLLPGISKIVAEIGQKMGIRRVRIPAEVIVQGCESPSAMRRAQGRLVFRLATSRRLEFEKAGFLCADHFVGFGCGGRFCLDNWFSLIAKLPEGVTEVMVHPGADTKALEDMTHWGYRWEEEMAALTDPRLRKLLDYQKVQLINYGDLS